MIQASKRLPGTSEKPRGDDICRSGKIRYGEGFSREERIYAWLNTKGAKPGTPSEKKQEYFAKKKREVVLKSSMIILPDISSCTDAEKGRLRVYPPSQLDGSISGLAARRKFSDSLQSIDLFSGLSINCGFSQNKLDHSRIDNNQNSFVCSNNTWKTANLELDLPTPLLKPSRKRKATEISTYFKGLSESAP